ncbi:hypothetical protein ABW19_dt0200368 [Dactylella cylindrospora]|nr:hypothetical protein ABW19_dt0200368 [Dactylella cylindrospora]
MMILTDLLGMISRDIPTCSAAESSTEITKLNSNNNNNQKNIPLLYLAVSLCPLLLLLISLFLTIPTFAYRRNTCHPGIATLKTTYHLLQYISGTPSVNQASYTAWSLLTEKLPVFFPFCFMPSAPTTAEQNTINQQESPLAQSNSNQYGILPASHSPHPPLYGTGAGSSSPQPGEVVNFPQYPRDEEDGDMGREADGSDASGHFVNSPRLPPELTSKSSAKKKYKCPNAKGQPYITRLPNEVLTHTLSFLDPISLSSVSFVSQRFHALVTSPHAWKDAFSRYFPQHKTHAGSDAYPATARYFTRLSSMGTHRNEYRLRTQLLRSLKRGRPYTNSGGRQGSSNNASNFSMLTYWPKLYDSTITHLHADFGKNRVIAASQFTGLYSYSDPRTGYVEVEQKEHPGYSPFGLQYISSDGIGSMDISESRGQVIGDAREGFPTFSVERAGSSLPPIRFINDHGPDASITCVWLAKKDTIVNTSGHAIMSASGSSKGTVQFQGTGSSWMSFLVCPGIPIVDIRIDDGYTKARERRNRVWCVIVNALGEVWYMKGKLPKKTLILGRNMGEQPPQEFTPWFVIPSTRKANAPVGLDILEPADPSNLEGIQQQNDWMHADPLVMMTTYLDHWRSDYFVEADFGGQNFLVGCKGYEDGPNLIKRRAKLSKYTRILDNVREEAISEVFIKNIYGRGYHRQIEEPVPRPPGEVDPPDEWNRTELEIPRNSGRDHALITAMAIDMSNLALLSPNEDPILTRSSGNPPLTPQQVAGQLSRLFAIGTDTGIIHIYNARHPTSSALNPLPPLHTITTASPSISSLALSSLYLVHGGTDGLVQAWDPLASLTDPIRAIHSRFSTRARRRLAQAANSVHGIGENQFAARAIFLDPDPQQLRGIVALGTQIRTWSFSSSIERVDENSNARRRRKGARRGSNASHVGPTSSISRRGGNSSKALLPRDIVAETERLGMAKYEDSKQKEKMKKRFGVGHENLAGMSEEEMVMYAMMISEESFEKERGLSDTPAESSGGSGSLAGESIMEEFGDEEVWIYSESGSPSVGTMESPPSQDGWMERDMEQAESSSAAISSPTNLGDDEALAKALQESFDLEESSRSPPSGELDIPIKFGKMKQKRGKGKFVAGSASGCGTSSARRSSGRQEQEQFDKDLELAIQLSMRD